MRRYVSKRLLTILPSLFGLLVLSFALVQLMPGDPAAAIAGEGATPQMIEAVRQNYGFDKPIWVQFLIYIEKAATLDFGTSFFTQRPVAADLLERLPATLELILLSLAISAVVGVALGTLAAINHNSLLDQVIRIATVAGLALAAFWVGIMLQIYLSMELGLFPLRGRLSVGTPAPPFITGLYLVDSLLTGHFTTFVDALRHLALPAITLALGPLATIARFTRATVLETMQMDFVAYETAVGYSRRRVVWTYVLRNSLSTTITQLGLLFGSLLSGAVAVEAIFNWPGIGSYTVQAIFTSDFNAILAVILLTGLVYLLVNILVDLVHAWIDPRISEQL
jgi:peptide/nickel transport system permease protein